MDQRVAAAADTVRATAFEIPGIKGEFRIQITPALSRQREREIGGRRLVGR